MVENYMDGWKNLYELDIPPIEKAGFQENVIIRNKVDAVTLQRPDVQIDYSSNYDGRPVMATNPIDFSVGETTVLEQNVQQIAVVKRLRNGEETVVEKESFIIGKGSRADYIVQGNPAISRQHITIRCSNGEYYMEDMNSTNHTYIADERVTHPVLLTDGTIFKLADEVFEFTLKPM